MRSQLAEDLRGYYESLIETLDRTPWYRQGKLIRASEVAIPAHVFTRETTTAANDGQMEVAWKDELWRVKRAVVVGAWSGVEMSFLSEITAVALAREALEQLEAQCTPLDSLPFPIHLELTELAQQGLRADPADALVELVRHKYRFSARLEPWVQEKLRTEQCWLILDALDQVDERDRPRLNDRQKALETQGFQCHVVLTCRTANYDRAEVPWGTLMEYELAPFRPQEIRQFIEKWFGHGNERGEALSRVLNRTFPLGHACRNPLIATLTCLAHEEGEVTEETRRGDLYARVLCSLARRAWKEDPLNPQDPRIGDLLRPLPLIARVLFELRPESNRFTESEIFESISAAPNLPCAPIPFRDDLLERGILVGAGLSRDGEAQFSFLHRTFLEYLTACSLARRVNSEGWQAIAAFVDKKAWLPTWQEVIVLLAGKLSDPIPLLELLSDMKKDDYLRHRLALGALCLSEILSEIRNLEFKIADHITTAAFSFWWKHKINGTAAAVLQFTRALPTLALVNGLMNGTPLLERLCQVLGDADSYMRSNNVPPVLVYVDRQSFDSEIPPHLHAADALAWMGEAAATHPKVLPTLLAILTDETNLMRSQAAKILGRMGEAAARHSDVLPALVEHALHDSDWQVIREAVVALGQIGEAAARHPDVLPTLVECALHGVDRDLPDQAAQALRQMGEVAVTHPGVFPRLLAALGNVDGNLCFRAARALGRMGEAAAQHPDVLPALLAALNNGNERARYGALCGLGDMGEAATGHPGVLPALVATLRDMDRDLSSQAARALGQMREVAAKHPDVLPALLACVNGTDPVLSREAAKALGQMREAAAQHPDVLPALAKCALGFHYWFPMIREAAWALGQMGEVVTRHPDVIPDLLRPMRYLESWSEACGAARALGEIGNVAGRHPDVVPALHVASQYSSNRGLRLEALGALGHMGEEAAKYPYVVAALVAIVRDRWGVRLLASIPEKRMKEKLRARAAVALLRMGEAVMYYPKVLPAVMQYVLCDASEYGYEEDTHSLKEKAEKFSKVVQVTARYSGVLPTLIAGLGDARVARSQAVEVLRCMMAQGTRIFKVGRRKWVGLSVAELSRRK